VATRVRNGYHAGDVGHTSPSRGAELERPVAPLHLRSRKKPLFAVHAGEFVAGGFIERHFRRVNVWVPAKDTGVDLLVSDARNKRVASFQVKFSRDFLATDMPAVFQKPLRACGWWTLEREKAAKSPADYWIFVLAGFARRSTDFIIISPSELLRRLEAIHGRLKRI
jgi:hypothetical protein